MASPIFRRDSTECDCPFRISEKEDISGDIPEKQECSATYTQIMARRIQIDERLVREAAAEIERLRKRVSDLERSPVQDAIQKSLEQPATGNGRNRVVSDIVRPALFVRHSEPVSKSARLQAEADRKKRLRRERDRALGLRPED
jgi:hypothetical protein